MNTATILRGDAVTMLRTLPAQSVHCCVTSPPYWGLRDYGTGQWEGGDPECDHKVGNQVQDSKAPGAITNGVRPGIDASKCRKCGAQRIDKQLGMEPTPAEYVSNIVAVFAEVWRVLRDDGVLWLNVGDSYAANRPGGQPIPTNTGNKNGHNGAVMVPPGLKPKDLVGIPWRLAFALQDAGWYLRSDVIWHKPNPMPESVTDRPTKAHEYVFLLTKRARYFYDAAAVAEDASTPAQWRDKNGEGYQADYSHGERFSAGGRVWGNGTRNRRSVWTINPEPTPYAHFATMPTALVEPCILAGTSARGVCPECGAPWVRVVEKTPYTPPSAGQGERNVDASRGDKNRKLNGKSAEFRESQASATTIGWVPSCACDAGDPIPATVLDPFAGSGTTLRVAVSLGRDGIGVELNPEYADLAERLLARTQPALIAI